jgi:hypothetical protein
MSGAQIGTAVGFVAGFFLPGGPQVWAAIGGMVGGWISPTQVNGPRIGDGQSQSSAEGMPIPWILGTGPQPIQGQIVQVSPRREVKKTDDGKGSGTEVNTYEAHQDFCILICESSEHRNSLMKGVLFVLVDGKIVYDMRPEANFNAENAKFLENHTFYNGNESQMPDPTMEALVGVDNALAYRGVFTMVGRDINLSAYGDRIPVYQFVMVGEGEATNTTVTTLVPPSYSEFRAEAWPLVQTEAFYTYTGSRGGGSTFSADTIAEIIEHFADFYDGIDAPPDQFIGYSAGTNFLADEFGINGFETQPDVTDNQSLMLVYNQESTANYIGSSTAYCSDIPWPGPDTQSDLYMDIGGNIFRKQTATSPGGGSTHWPGSGLTGYCTGDPTNTDGFFPAIEGWAPLLIKVDRKTIPPAPVLGDPCLLGYPTLLPDSPGFVQNCDGDVFATPTYAPATGANKLMLQPASFVTDGSRTLFLTFPVGPVMETTDPDNTQAYWESKYDAAVLAGTMPPGYTWSVEYPVSVAASTVYTATSETNEITTDTLGLDTLITRICERGGLTADDIDVTEMDQQVLGFGVLQPYTATEALSVPLQAFLSFGTESDAKLRFHKHGSDVDLVIDPQDFIEGSDETEDNTREQEIEYPRLLSVNAIDPTQNYTPRPQTARRTSPNVKAIGEQTMELSVVLPPEYHAQLADIGLKVLWARAQGTRKFSVPYAQAATYLRLVPGMPCALEGQRYIVDKMRLGDGEIHLELVYDRQSAYTSDVQPTPALPPTPPPSNIGGVTISAFLNAGVFRDQDDRVGIYVAVAGILPSWPGCMVQWKLSTDSDWQTAIASATQASTMGYLTAPLPLAPAAGDDVTNTLSVSVHGGELNSVTRFQYLMERNPFAIITNTVTGECEVGQFQDANETAPGEYDLTTLVRGGLNTTPAAHTQGARFVFLDSVYFLEVPSAWIGRTIDIRPVTLGTSPDNNASYSITLDPAVSQTEWQVGHLDYTEASGTVSLVITPRHRLGNDVAPIASTNFIGYQIEVEDDADQYNAFTSTTPTVSIDISTLTTPVTITVSALNRFPPNTGPSMSIVIP